jgi:DNA repair exonuclease SbcCD nuclease subunit
MKIKENEGVTDSQKESLYSRLDPEVKFYEDHRTQLAGAGSLDDLVSASDLAEKRYTGVTENLIYTSLLAISIGKTNKSRQTTGQIASALKAKVSEITENGDKDVSFLDRYFSDMESKLSESQKKAEEAEKVMAKAEKAAVRSRSSYYLDALGNVQGAYNYIKEVATNLEEMVRLIKTN